MKITFTTQPDRSSFPVLIINGLESSPFPRLPGQPYTVQFPIRSSDTQKGRLDISALIKGQANTSVKITIHAFIHGSSKPPLEVNVEGSYSNRQSFIFSASLVLPKGSSVFQGKRNNI